MSEEEARNFGIGPAGSNQRRRYFRVDNGKANLAPPPDKADWYFLESVHLGNGRMGLASGDNVGVVVTWTPPDPLQCITEADLPSILERVATGEYRADAQAKDWVGKVVAVRGHPPAGREPKRDRGFRPAEFLRWTRNIPAGPPGMARFT
jgi:hypothetical protein